MPAMANGHEADDASLALDGVDDPKAADAVITRNIRDFAGAELRFPNLRIVRPEHFIKE